MVKTQNKKPSENYLEYVTKRRSVLWVDDESNKCRFGIWGNCAIIFMESAQYTLTQLLISYLNLYLKFAYISTL